MSKSTRISKAGMMFFEDLDATVEIEETIPLLPDPRGAKGHFSLKNNNYAFPLIIHGLKIGRKVLEEGKDYFIGNNKIEPGEHTWISFYIDDRVKNIMEKGKRVNILYGSYEMPEVIFNAEEH